MVGDSKKNDDLDEIKKQALNGNAEAQFKLGYGYVKGIWELPQSIEEAKYWYQKSAQQGFVPAQYNLASIYLQEGNEAESFRWMKKSAESGEDSYAQYMLGEFYLNGIGCSQNTPKGLFWLDKAAEQGVEEAIEELNEIREEISNY